MSITPQEKATLNLRELYEKFGYKYYRMNKFEEYGFYAKNKQSLISNGIITFTDVNGKLMALKPDVTLSIIKNLHDVNGLTQKFYYDEKVYRVSKNHNSFREINQVGIETVGKIDNYFICEVINLALESLNLISNGRKFILDVSDLDALKNLLPENNREYILNLIAEKNSHELKKVLGEDHALTKNNFNNLKSEKLNNILEIFKNENNINPDFSTVNDPNYYNGIVFRGYIEGVPDCILSGGQYDKLVSRMHNNLNLNAIGFAIYTDLLAGINNENEIYDADILILYDDSTPINKILECVKNYTGSNMRVNVQKNIIPENFKYKKLVNLNA